MMDKIKKEKIIEQLWARHPFTKNNIERVFDYIVKLKGEQDIDALLEDAIVAARTLNISLKDAARHLYEIKYSGEIHDFRHHEIKPL
jgi:hypothetical protein